MKAINPYLNFAGNTEEAFNFYKSVFGGEFAMLQKFGEGNQIPASVKDKVMHVSLPIGNNILMGTDACEEMGFNVTQGNNFYICISPDSKEEADKLFNALAEGGKITMPLAKQFWGAKFGMLTDKYGIGWMLNHEEKK